MGPYRVKISFDVLQLLNHRTNGRCTTQAWVLKKGHF